MTATAAPPEGFEFGLEGFLADPTLRGRVGLVTNATGRDRRGIHLVDRLARHPRLRLVAIFTPEHGFGADAPDGEHVGDTAHPQLGIPIHSLYGPCKSPRPEHLRDLDLLVYDIQDVGVRFYTYISTLRNTIDAAIPARLPVHVLDRPDLLGGLVVEGPLLDPALASFVGHLPIPLRYGMTPGELARWWNARLEVPADLTVWPCRGYRRGTPFSALNVPWVQPSPSMVSPDTAQFYPGTCLFEGTNVSEGRGSSHPFQKLGAPWIDAHAWVKALEPLLPSGIEVGQTYFTPTFSKFTGELCEGIFLTTTRPFLEQAVVIGLAAIQTLMQTHPGQVSFPGRPGMPAPFFDHLAGCAAIREALEGQAPWSTLAALPHMGLESFLITRKEALLYQEGSSGTAPKP
jgi:uncharacterized protein YbbC (DUF1343 family)